MKSGATWTEIAAAKGPLILVVPVGSCEQHGPHLPLDTDTRIALAVSEMVRHLPFVVVGPALGYGASGEHAEFEGTLSLGTEVLCQALVEIVRSSRLAYAGVAFVCAHGGNAEGLGRARDRLDAEGDRILVWMVAPRGGDLHAGKTETSLMLAIAPEAVRRDAIEPGPTDPLGTLWPELRARGLHGVTANGVLGDPTLASAEEGESILSALGDELASAVCSWWNELCVTT